MKSNADFVPIKLKVVTPLFLGNARQEAEDAKIMDSQSELRPPSLKGVLRFWHRVANPDNLKTEAKYFGSTNGQASFLLQVQNLPPIRKPQKWEDELGYLGYGPIIRVKKVRQLCSRQYIEPGKTLELRLVFRPGASKDTKEAVLRSFRLLSLFGGLGSRSRHGFGSVILADKIPNNVQELISQIKNELTPCSFPRETNYTAFSQSSRVVIPFVKTSWKSALQSIEEAMRKYRSNEVFKSDSVLIKKYLNSGTIDHSPQRVTFGLPHNYFFKDTNQSVTIEPLHEQYSRRASPLFIHVHQLANERFAVIVSFFPAPLLPKGVSLQVKEVINDSKKARISQKPCTIPTPEGLAPVNGFMDYLLDFEGAREVIGAHG